MSIKMLFFKNLLLWEYSHILFWFWLNLRWRLSTIREIDSIALCQKRILLLYQLLWSDLKEQENILTKLPQQTPSKEHSKCESTNRPVYKLLDPKRWCLQQIVCSIMRSLSDGAALNGIRYRQRELGTVWNGLRAFKFDYEGLWSRVY